MQLVKASRNAIMQPLARVVHIASRRSSLPILGNVLIRKVDDEMTLLATSLEVQVTARTRLGHGRGSASAAVDASKLINIVRALHDGAEITATLTEKRISVQSGKSRFNLQVLPESDFPLMLPPEQTALRLEVACEALHGLLASVQYAAARADVRTYLNGVYLSVEKDSITAVGTDGTVWRCGSLVAGRTRNATSSFRPRRSMN